MASGRTKSLQGICHLLMAALFALSASFQFNDADWYFWIPLYATACAVNLTNWENPNLRIIRKMAKFAFWLGVFLFIKVALEGFLKGTRGSWSLDMRERIVREKFGSGLVISSMFLCLENPSRSNYSARITKYGLPMLVGIAYGLSFLFFAFQQGEMRY